MIQIPRFSELYGNRKALLPAKSLSMCMVNFEICNIRNKLFKVKSVAFLNTQIPLGRCIVEVVIKPITKAYTNLTAYLLIKQLAEICFSWILDMVLDFQYSEKFWLQRPTEDMNVLQEAQGLMFSKGG